MQTLTMQLTLQKAKCALETYAMNNPREEELPSSLEGSSASCGAAPWLEANIEHNYNKARIKELE